MAKTIPTETKEQQLPIGLSAATGVLWLVLLIPVAYTFISNIQKESVMPEIKPAPRVVQQIPLVSTSALDAAVKAASENPGYKTLLNLGLEYYSVGNYKQSIEVWNKALTYNNSSDLLYTNIAAAYGALQMWDEEIAACEKALSINPNFDLAKRNLNWAKQMKNKK